MPVRRLTENALASAHFKKWVQSVLTTTQVTQNVILLALMFIYRLKVANPTVRGRPGSEYRLLTVALMLGNKFLDDNTYTNKTWAEVSGIAVGEIHVMEVEFLSNMRYSLLASKDQWEEWLVKLARFWEYCDRAEQPVVSPLVIPSPTHRGFTSPLPSPTGNLQLPSSSKAEQAWHSAYQASSPLSSRPDLHARKRPFPDDDLAETPAKRLSLHPDSTHMPVQHITQSRGSSPGSPPTAGPGANPPAYPELDRKHEQRRPHCCPIGCRELFAPTGFGALPTAAGCRRPSYGDCIPYLDDVCLPAIRPGNHRSSSSRLLARLSPQQRATHRWHSVRPRSACRPRVRSRRPRLMPIHLP